MYITQLIIIDSKDISKGILYLYNIYIKYFKKEYFYCCLKIFEHILNLLDRHEEILTQNNNSSENDYIRLAWSDLLEQLFSFDKTVKVITGETVSSFSTANRKEQYNIVTDDNAEDCNGEATSKKVLGFKIDIRLVYNNRQPYIDLCSGEVAKKEDDKKIISDQSKVIREAKDNLDFLLTLLPNDLSRYCVGWSILIAGTTCSISCLHLDANGLYVNVPHFDFSLPSNILTLPDFEKSLSALLTLRREVYKLVEVLQKGLSKEASIVNSLGRSHYLPALNHKLLWKRDTYYPPPGTMSSVVPKNLFGNPVSKAIETAIDDDVFKRNVHEEEDAEVEVVVRYDEFGWGNKEGRWFNTLRRR